MAKRIHKTSFSERMETQSKTEKLKKVTPKQPLLHRIKTELGPNGYQRWLSEELMGCGAMVFKIHGHALQEAGWPDVYCSHPLFHGWIEVKVKAKLEARQATKLQGLCYRQDHALILRWDVDRQLHQIQCVRRKETTGLHVYNLWNIEPGIRGRDFIEQLALAAKEILALQ